MSRLLQIVPRLPPSVCGVGDCSLLAAEALRKGHDIDTRFLVADPAWTPQDQHGGFAFERFDVRGRPASNLILKASSDCGGVLLQYSGYGFSPRGAPLWLLAAIRRFRQARPHAPLIIMFHELHATGPVYRSSFWLSWAQRHITRSLALLADHVHVNRSASARWIERSFSAKRDPCVVMPVFSNLGERPDLPPPSQRERRLVLFGHQAADTPGFWLRLKQIAETLKADALSILTKPLRTPPDWPRNIAVDSHGVLPAGEVSAILGAARWGLLSYPPAFLGKSGVLAAMLAHGIVPVLLDECDGSLSEGLQLGKHLLVQSSLAAATENDALLDRVSADGAAWYQRHDIAATAACYASHLKPSARSAAG